MLICYPTVCVVRTQISRVGSLWGGVWGELAWQLWRPERHPAEADKVQPVTRVLNRDIVLLSLKDCSADRPWTISGLDAHDNV
eukprot:367290-Pyramimonas_sp.AAC.2